MVMAKLCKAYLPGTGETVIADGGAPMVRPFHCTIRLG